MESPQHSSKRVGMTDLDERLLAGVELGGTKAIAVLARGRSIIERHLVPTRAPEQTLADLIEILGTMQARHGRAAALGVASFGPVRLRRESKDFGHLLDTPKQGWSGIDVLGGLSRCVDGPAAIDTDVNAAALAEGLWGASQGCSVHIYLTIGTGIGGGVVVAGKPVHGALHPEIGHIRVRRDATDPFPGICPFHGDCLEGLASGPAIAARAGAPADRLPADHEVWTRVSREIGESLANLILMSAAERIVIGGGVGEGCGFLLPRIRQAALDSLSGYGVASNPLKIDELIARTGLGGDAGPLGSIVLARSALSP